jgi:RNA polymerase sigma factor (sigma-70 family)
MKQKSTVDTNIGIIEVEQSTFEKLISMYKSKIFSYIRLYIRDEAMVEDIFQDTLLKVFQCFKAGKYSDNGKFISWVNRIAHNLIIDHFRRVKQLSIISNDDYESDLFSSKKFAEDSIEDNMVKQQIHKDVRKMISNLPDDQKEVIIMRHYNDLSFKEIASITNVSINTAIGRMRYALLNIRKQMADNNINLEHT